ncbi:hypothetical protein D046_5814C, partial [Vibrio parahaemolyticus V-223/04]
RECDGIVVVFAVNRIFFDV